MSGRLAWITGAGGLVGNYLVQAAPRFAPGWRVRPLTRPLELTDFPAVQRALETDAPALIIHCAALSKSPDCQRDPGRARLLNVEVTRNLTTLARDIPLVFFSTDLVFDGRKGNYAEDDAPNPLSVYAQTKVEAERLVLANPRHTVIRASLNAGISPTGNRAFNERMRLAWQAEETLTLFTDEFRCPLPAVITARAVWELVRSNQPGLYHLAGAERLSRWEIGRLLAKRWFGENQTRARMRAGSVRDYADPRSADTSLCCARIQNLLSFPLPKFSEWLQENPDEPLLNQRLHFLNPQPLAFSLQPSP
jgi:dTDP-4-dehydrorhamnose reductase